MRWVWLVCTLMMAVAAEDDAERGHHNHEEDSHADHYHGHSMMDFSTIGILLALKLKLILLGLAVAAVAILFKNTKPSYGYYPYIDYEYVGYPVPPAAYMNAPYRRPPIAIAPKSIYLSELTARVWNSIDLPGMALGAMGVPDGSCRRRVVCQAERVAGRNTIMKTALGLFGGSLSKYKPRSDSNQQASCEELYADCPSYNLPSFLGGSDPRIPQTHSASFQHFRNPWFGHSVPPATNNVGLSSEQASRPDPRKDLMKSSLAHSKTM